MAGERDEGFFECRAFRILLEVFRRTARVKNTVIFFSRASV